MNYELPVHVDAERLVLGRMMNSINAANSVFENLEETDFSTAEHRSIFKAGLSLFRQDRPIDATAILAELEKIYPEHADYSNVFGLAQYSFGMTNDFLQFVEIVRDHSISRKVMNFSKEMLEVAASKKLTSDEIKNKFLEDSDVIFKSLNNTKLRTLTEVGKGNFKESGKTFLEYVEWKQEESRLGRSTISGYLSGYKLLDDCLEGFNKRHYIIIGARPGVGKTTFILNLMLRFMKQNLKIGFFSLEMSAEDVVEKFGCISARVEHKKVSRGKGLTHDEYGRLVASFCEIGDSILIDDQPNLYLSQLSARAKRMVHAGVQIIFIDYISEVRVEGRFPNKQEQIQHVSKGIRAIAKNLNIPIICIAQLNRESEKANRLPVKSDLRESGQIEADAYSILLLHRPEQENINDQPGKMILRVVKNRMGRENDFDFAFDGKTGEISEMGYKNRDYGATSEPNDPYKYFKEYEPKEE